MWDCQKVCGYQQEVTWLPHIEAALRHRQFSFCFPRIHIQAPGERGVLVSASMKLLAAGASVPRSSPPPDSATFESVTLNADKQITRELEMDWDELNLEELLTESAIEVV